MAGGGFNRRLERLGLPEDILRRVRSVARALIERVGGYVGSETDAVTDAVIIVETEIADSEVIDLREATDQDHPVTNGD